MAYIVTRPTTEQGGAELFFEQTAMLCVYYNAINLIEHSKLLIIEWYKNNGFRSLLKLKPELVTASWVDSDQTANRYGIDPATKIHWLTMMRDYLRDKSNIDKCNHPELLNAWAKFRYEPGSGNKYNCDITIATSLCIILEADEKELMVQEVKNSQPKGEMFSYYKTDKNGIMISSANFKQNNYTNVN